MNQMASRRQFTTVALLAIILAASVAIGASARDLERLGQPAYASRRTLLQSQCPDGKCEEGEKAAEEVFDGGSKSSTPESSSTTSSSCPDGQCEENAAKAEAVYDGSQSTESPPDESPYSQDTPEESSPSGGVSGGGTSSTCPSGECEEVGAATLAFYEKGVKEAYQMLEAHKGQCYHKEKWYSSGEKYSEGGSSWTCGSGGMWQYGSGGCYIGSKPYAVSDTYAPYKWTCQKSGDYAEWQPDAKYATQCYQSEEGKWYAAGEKSGSGDKYMACEGGEWKFFGYDKCLLDKFYDVGYLDGDSKQYCYYNADKKLCTWCAQATCS